MKLYRIYSLDQQGQKAGLKEVRCRDDLDALAEGEKAARDTGVEIWTETRLVARVKEGNAALTMNDKHSL